MRHLTDDRTTRRATAAMRRACAGLTLVETMVAVAIGGLLLVAATPHFGEYHTNSRLRESGHTLYAEALIAQSEAIKRNRPVRLAASAGTVQVIDVSDPARPTVLRTRLLAPGVRTDATAVDFGSQGWPVGLVGATIDLAHETAACSAEQRCPRLRIEAGGAIRLCADRLADCT